MQYLWRAYGAQRFVLSVRELWEHQRVFLMRASHPKLLLLPGLLLSRRAASLSHLFLSFASEGIAPRNAICADTTHLTTSYSERIVRPQFGGLQRFSEMARQVPPRHQFVCKPMGLRQRR
jgi:hypothetical protein